MSEKKRIFLTPLLHFRPRAIEKRFFGALFLFLLMGAVPLFAQVLSHPALLSTYRGEPNHVLARGDFGELTESDLYLFLLMMKRGRPDLFARYQEAEPGSAAAEALRRNLDAAIREWAMTVALSGEVADEEIAGPLDEMRLRFLLYPVHELIWIDRLVAPEVLVAQEDLRKYYAENPEDFPAIPTARVRYIFLKVETDDTLTSEAQRERWDAARARMDVIYDRILLKTETFESAARKHSEADNAEAGGLTPEFTAGTFFEAFEKAAFDLPPGNFSVLDGPDGVYLLQREATAPAGILPFEKVVPKIQEQLFLKQLARRTEGEAAKLRSRTGTANRAHIFRLLGPRVPIVKVRGFRLNLGMIQELFPDLFADSFEVNPQRFVRVMQNVETSELIAQDNERRGWDADVRFLPAVRLARAILKSEKQAARLIHPHLALSRPQVRAYLRTYPSRFSGLRRAGGALVQARLLDADAMGEVNRQRKMDAIREVMVESRDRYASETLDAIAASWPVKEADPLHLIPTLIEWELIERVADASVSVLRWNTGQSLNILPEEAKSLGEELVKRAAENETPRFAPLLETESTISLLYVEKPDYETPVQADLNHFRLYRTVAATVETWARAVLRHEITDREGALEILIP